jgi:hypothetical protein
VRDGDIAGASQRPYLSRRDRRFESPLLQR